MFNLGKNVGGGKSTLKNYFEILQLEFVLAGSTRGKRDEKHCTNFNLIALTNDMIYEIR